MSEENQNKPAYPVIYNVSETTQIYGGLTKREYFAGLAMRLFTERLNFSHERAAVEAVEYADALLQALEE